MAKTKTVTCSDLAVAVRPMLEPVDVHYLPALQTDADYAVCRGLFNNARTALAQAEALLEDSYTGPLKSAIQANKQVVSSLEAAFKSTTAPLSEYIGTLKTSMEAYQTQKMLVVKQEADAAVAALRESGQAEQAAALAATSEVWDTPGNLSRRTEVTVSNARLVPDEYKVVDLAAVKRAMKTHPELVIPGIKVDKKIIVVNR